MSYHFDPINGNMNDLNPRGYGYGQCQAGSAFSTSSESFNLVYYVEDGYGTLEKNGRIYTVNAGEAFVILSGEAAHCKADDKEPWFLRAVGFDGELGGDFSVLPDVFSADSLFFSEISKLSNDSVKKTSLLTSLLFLWHSEICQDDSMPINDYVQQIKNYVSMNYMNNISVGKIAAQMNISRSYLGRIVKKSMGLTIQEYIASVRVEAAKKCLEGKMSVTETAYACGYGDLSNFSKMFKKNLNISPAEYKKNLPTAGERKEI